MWSRLPRILSWWIDAAPWHTKHPFSATRAMWAFSAGVALSDHLGLMRLCFGAFGIISILCCGFWRLIPFAVNVSAQNQNAFFLGSGHKFKFIQNGVRQFMAVGQSIARRHHLFKCCVGMVAVTAFSTPANTFSAGP